MRVLILGIDGYIGYPLAIHLLERNHEVHGIDNFSRRARVKEIGSESLTSILLPTQRTQYLMSTFGQRFPHTIAEVSLGNDPPNFISYILSVVKPDAIIHLAEQPSAPWSMIDANHASETQRENVLGTLHLLWAIKKECPEAHLIKLGTMGEYGTPPCDIPEGTIPEGPMKGLLFPRTAGSFYHLSKVHDTHNIEFACRNWGLRSTDIMQGIVFGLNSCQSKEEMTRFDYDEYFGTVLNRFVVQSIIGHSLTLYGKGNQTRGLLPLKDSIQCLTIALENPPSEGEYRTFNQFESIYSVDDIAYMVTLAADVLGLQVHPSNIPNPRKEQEDHYYNPCHRKLLALGYQPTTDIQADIVNLMLALLPYKDKVIEQVIMPTTNWR